MQTLGTSTTSTVSQSLITKKSLTTALIPYLNSKFSIEITDGNVILKATGMTVVYGGSTYTIYGNDDFILEKQVSTNLGPRKYWWLDVSKLKSTSV